MSLAPGQGAAGAGQLERGLPVLEHPGADDLRRFHENAFAQIKNPEFPHPDPTGRSAASNDPSA
ncbi:MAG: hypothetical protein N2037_07520 [Acidimicrobiales bacterium]|nr:hypothetical protein [Acidimicrobiales bacterium]